MGAVREILKAAGFNPQDWMITTDGEIKPVSTRTFKFNPKRIPRGNGTYKYSNNPNANRAGGGEKGSQGNSDNTSSN